MERRKISVGKCDWRGTNGCLFERARSWDGMRIAGASLRSAYGPADAGRKKIKE
jgi:hypothetical protein